MNKKMREILAKISEKTNQAKAFMSGENKDINKANELLDEIDDLKKEYETEKRLFEMEKENSTPSNDDLNKQGSVKDSTKAFADAARRGFKSMNEGSREDGGYVVPEDIQTRINEYRDSKFSLRSLVRVEKVTTNKGSRTFKKREQQTGFNKVGEGGKIGAKNTPKFERVDYEIDKYGGYFPVTNEFLADTDSNITNTIIEWIGDEARVTDNVQIISVLKTFGAKTIDKTSPIDSIKSVLNIDLGQAFKPTSRIITNDNGLNFLDTLKDKDGKYLLQPNPLNPMQKQLCAGATVIPLEVIGNKDLPNDGTKIPFVIGDLFEGMVLWDRELLTIKQSDTAQIGELNAFENDLTIYRALLREDFTKRDDKAVFYCTLETGE